MDRIFHSRIKGIHAVYIGVVAALAFFMLWHKVALLALGCVIWLVVAVERLIHTTYTVTDDRLVIYRGRFWPKKEILLADINIMGIVHRMSLPRPWCYRNLMLVCDDGKTFVLYLSAADNQKVLIELQKREEEKMRKMGY